MKFGITDDHIPGTQLNREKMGNVTGLEFLHKIFYITNGIMLNQIREISGLDGSTLQNWVKRGWLPNTRLKKYNIDQLARILIINMLRDTMLLERIDFLLKYINGTLDCKEDDIISESKLYDYICRILDSISEEDSTSNEELRAIIKEVTSDYDERVSGARRRLCAALEIIIFSYYAKLIKGQASSLFEQL